MTELISLNSLDKLVNGVLDGEISPIKAYTVLKEVEKKFKDAQKQIDVLVRGEIMDNPNEYKDFSLSYRTTYNYKENQEWCDKNKELKDIEDKLKKATQMQEKGASYVDEDGVIIEPVTTNVTEVLTYKPKK